MLSDNPYKEVYFHFYCPTCIHKEEKEDDGVHCNECLHSAVNLYSHKPVNYISDGSKKGEK